MYYNTIGTANTAIGRNALYANTEGIRNVAVGEIALDSNTTGLRNTAVGRSAMATMQTASYNTGVGHSALGDTTTGHSNTAVGNGALNDTTTGDYNIGIGHNAQSSAVGANGECTLGDTNVDTLRCNDTSIGSLSDERDKTDIINSPYGLDFINTVQPRQFKWETRDGNVKDGKTRLGFTAQELLTACDGNNDVLDLVYESNPDKLEAKYANLIPILTKAIQELSAKVTALENA